MGEVARDLVVGWVAGAAGIAVTHPLDTVRVRMQYLTGQTGALCSAFPNLPHLLCTMPLLQNVELNVNFHAVTTATSWVQGRGTPFL